MEVQRKFVGIKEPFEDKEYLPRILKFLCEHGFCCDAYKPSYLQRRVLVRLRANQLKSYREYYKLLRSNSEEQKKVVEALTINVTGFFRDYDVYKFIQEQLVADILGGNEERRHVRIWSAGCATGEEPYSIAMLILESLGGDRARPYVSIFATDIDEPSLEVARVGSYPSEKLERLSNDLIQRYFVFNKNWQVTEDLKSLIKFKRLDLLTDKGIKLCDVIFCRNVLIYFNRIDQERTLKMFYECLKPRGYIILGKTEILPFGFSDKFSCVNTKAHIYRKMEAPTD